jgi:hypothetical protein
VNHVDVGRTRRGNLLPELSVTVTMRTTMRVLMVSMLVAGPALLSAAPASAKCVGDPPASAHRFTGTVVAVQRSGRLAEVRTDDGRTVMVSGTPSEADPPGRVAVTSVDRTFAVGARYEFHPLNGASPYQDNACTATRQIAAVALPAAASSAAASQQPQSVAAADADSGGGAGLLLLGAFGTAMILVAAGLVILARLRLAGPGLG